MRGWGTVLSGSGGLAVTVPGERWGFTLRRADFRPDDVFLGYHGREIAAPEVARFLPNWQSLRWVHVPAGLLTPREVTATDREYMIYVSAAADSGMTHEAIIGAFLGFMS
jgi:hypothetical protein